VSFAKTLCIAADVSAIPVLYARRIHPFSRDAERSALRQPFYTSTYTSTFLTSTRKNALRYEFVGCVGTWGYDFSRRILRVAAKRENALRYEFVGCVGR